MNENPITNATGLSAVIPKDNDGYCTVYKLDCADGLGLMTVYQVYPGIQLIYNDFEATSCYWDGNIGKNVLEINHCREGREGSVLQSGSCLYLGEGDLSIHTMDNCASEMSFPLKHYRGISVVLDLELVSENPPGILTESGIDTADFKNKFCADGSCFVMRAKDDIEHIFSELYSVPDRFQKPYFMLKVQELLLFLCMVNTVKEVRPRYSCFYKIRHPGDCDGQSGYGVSKLDSIVEEVVRQIFAQFREVSRKKLLESVKTNDAARIQKKVKKIQKDLESKQKELDDLKAETILVIRGVSALDKELLGTLVAEAREALETLEKQLVQAQEEYEEATKTAKRSNYICNELFTWADVYDTANHDERRAILQQFIKEIRVRKDYEISITLNASFDQVEQLKAVSTYDGAEIFEGISEKGA